MNNVFSGAKKALDLNLDNFGLWNIAETSSYPCCIGTPTVYPNNASGRNKTVVNQSFKSQ